jgi:hypothetical protein
LIFKEFVMPSTFKSNPKVYSARIERNQGYSTPEAIPEISGWTVWKQEQSEIFIIQHNLGLRNPDRQMHIVATPVSRHVELVVGPVESNQFTISSYVPGGGPALSTFMFIAVHHP